MTWNNGYGNGGGNDVYEAMNRAREQGGARFPFIAAGRHKLALVTLENFQHRKAGKATRAIFKVLESTSHAPGTFVVRIFKIMEQPKYESSLSDAELLANMVIALKGAPKGFPIGQSLRTLLEERPAEQLARGTIVECNGVDNDKKTWVNLYWTTIQQTQEDVVAMRKRLEAEGIPDTGNKAGAPPAQPYGAPAPQGYPMPTQYATPQGVPPGVPPVQTQAAPQGGFLAQLPPQPGTGGPQGGNGGSSW